MRVAILSYHTCPLATLGGKDTGGMNVYVRDLTRHLGRLGIHVDVFTRSQDEHVPHVLHDLGYGNRVVHIKAGPEIPLPKRELPKLLNEFIEGILHFSDIKGIDYDLIHSHYWLSGLAASKLINIWRVPVVHMFHTLEIMKQRVARSNQYAESEERLQGEKQIIRIANRIIAATPAEFAQLQWLYQAAPEKIVIIPPGVDLSRFYPIPTEEAKEYLNIQSNVKMILYVGRIEPLKGIDILIEALALVKRAADIKDSQLCLTVIGGETELSAGNASTELARLQQLRTIYELEDLITFVGKQDQDSLPYYYSAAEVVVVPSHYESFGMVALEAMACGTPVVASQVGGLAFLVRDEETGFTVPVGEPQALADCLIRLLCDEKLRHSMGKQAAILAQEYDWNIIARRIGDLYQELLLEKG